MTTWLICSHEVNPTILLAVNAVIPEGYTVQAETANPRYLLDQGIAVAVDRKITVLAFRKRFTKAEKITMEMASIDNPSASMAARQMAASLRVDMNDSDTATFIDLERSDTQASVRDMETYGMIGPGRAQIILTAPIHDQERPALRG